MSNTTPSPAKTPKTHTITLCYVGAFVTSEEQLWHRYHRVAAGKLTEEMIFSRCFLGSPGTMFTIEESDETHGTLFRNTAKFAGLWHDEDARVRWMAASRAEENSHRESHAAKKAMSGNAALERLEPFKAAYRPLKADARRAMLAEIIRYITT